MATATITVRYVNPQQPGKKNATVKTEDDQLNLVPPEMIDQFSAGSRYSVTYTTHQYKNVTFRTIEKVEQVAQASTPAGRNTPGARYQDDMVVAERIFVCGAMNNMMANQNIDPRGLTHDNLVAEVKKLRAVWAATLGNPQKDDEMEDSVPY